MKKFLTLAMLAMLGAVSCNNKETVPAVGGGDLRIVFNTGDLTTKSDPAPSCGDGSAIYLSPSDEPDLVILVADQTDGDIIGWYPSANATLQDGPTTTSMAVSITGLGKEEIPNARSSSMLLPIPKDCGRLKLEAHPRPCRSLNPRSRQAPR